MKNNGYITHENNEVEHWMNRALRAEKQLQDEREATIRANPEISAHYKWLLNRIFG